MKFDLYFFLQNCKFPQGEQVIDEYILCDAGGLQGESFQAFLSRYVHANPYLPKIVPKPDAQWLRNCSARHPVTLIRRLNVEAPSEEDVLKQTAKDIQVIRDLLSLERGDSADNFASIVVNNKTSLLSFGINDQGYKGNLASPFSPISHQLAQYKEALEANPSFSIQIQLYREAAAERNLDFRYFKYWALLEVMATSDYGKRGTDGTRVTRMVKELYQANNRSTVIQEQRGEVLEERDVLGEIPLWERHRDCVAHHGMCQRNNPEVCRTEWPYAKCKEKVAAPKEPDRLLLDLETTSAMVIRLRLSREMTKLSKPA